MQEYWVNVYKCPSNGQRIDCLKHLSRREALIVGRYFGDNEHYKLLYHIHVKMKPRIDMSKIVEYVPYVDPVKVDIIPVPLVNRINGEFNLKLPDKYKYTNHNQHNHDKLAFKGDVFIPKLYPHQQAASEMLVKHDYKIPKYEFS